MTVTLAPLNVTLPRDQDPFALALVKHLNRLRMEGRRPTTIEQRGQALRRFARRIAPLDPMAVTHADLDDWQTNALYASSDIHRSCEVSHVAQFYKWAAREGLVVHGLTDILVRPRIPRRVPRPIAEADLWAAMQKAPRTRIRPWLVLGAWAGLRAGEIARLRREDVWDTAEPPALMIDGKGGHQRIVPMSSFVVAELRAAGLPDRGWLFPRLDGQPGPISPKQLSRVVNPWLHSVDIPDTFHSLRHRFGTRMYEKSRDLRIVQEVMGHADPKTSAGYVSWSNKAAFEAVEAIAPRRLSAVSVCRQAEPEQERV